MVKKSKISIIGAGYVGATVAYTLSTRNASEEIVLIDAVHEKAVGEVEDIKHGLCSWGEMNLRAGDYSDVAGSSLIIITAGSGRKPGETRLDLAQKNVNIAKSIMTEVMKYYTTGSIMVVSNPVDILTYAINKWTGLPEGTVFGTGTVLDSARFRSKLADMTGVDITNVHGYVIGEHGDSQVPVWSRTHIAGAQIDQYCRKQGLPLTDEIKAQIAHEVTISGSEIIKRKGATFYGISSCVCSLVSAIMRNKNSIFTISSILNGQFGIKDVALSLPAVTTNDGIKTVYEPDLSDDEIRKLLKSAEVCRNTLNSITL